MSLPKYPILLPSAVALNGDRTDIPLYASGGSFSYNSGFPSITQSPLSAGGIPPSRADFNGIFHELSQHTFYQQSGGMYAWSEELDYPLNAVVYGSNNVLYKAIQISGKSHAVGAQNPVSNSNYWERVTLAIPDGSTSVKGIVQLSTSVSSTSTVLAATSSAVKTAYDEAQKATSKAYVNATNNSSYIKFSNGIIMQWGIINSSIGSSGTQIVTLENPMPNTNYSVNVSYRYDSSSASAVVTSSNHTTTTFSLRCSGNGVSRIYSWFLIGK